MDEEAADAPPGWIHRIQDEAALREVYPAPTAAIAAHKHLGQLDPHCRAFIARATLCMVATADAAGRCDASPRGGPPGFVRIHDDHHLLIPDAPGNKRVDTFRNILANPRAGLCLFIPRYGEVLRVEGDAWLTRDPALRAGLEIFGREPVAVLVVKVVDAFLHCAKAVRRSGLWNPETWAPLDGMPSAASIWRDHTHGRFGTEGDVQALLDESYTNRLW